jgi:hypothetical protein
MGATSVTGISGVGAVPTPTTQGLYKIIEECCGSGGSGSGGSNSVARLSNPNDGNTLGTDYNVYFLSQDPNVYQTYTLNLPDPGLMVGRELLFLNVSNYSEVGVNLVGPIESPGQNTYFLGANAMFRMISDGTIWWTTQESYA